MAEYIDREALFAEFDRLGLGEHSIVEKVFSIGVRTIIAGMPVSDMSPVAQFLQLTEENREKVGEYVVQLIEAQGTPAAKKEGGDGDVDGS